MVPVRMANILCPSAVDLQQHCSRQGFLCWQRQGQDFLLNYYLDCICCRWESYLYGEYNPFFGLRTQHPSRSITNPHAELAAVFCSTGDRWASLWIKTTHCYLCTAPSKRLLLPSSANRWYTVLPWNVCLINVFISERRM